MGKRISPYGTYNGKYMSFEEYLSIYPDKDEVKYFLRGQELGRASNDPSKMKRLTDELINEFGSIEAAIVEFITATASIKSKWVPENERKNGSFEGLINHAISKEGIDLRKIEEEEGRCGSNGGRGCDVTKGPCSCGAWH